jgi:tetratricopeptide (TPR) repeat protein
MEIMPRAKAAAKEALAREPELPEGLTAMGSIQAVYDWDWAAAEQSFKRAIKANPNYAIAYHWYAIHCLTPTRRFAEARAAIERAWELEPLSLVILTTWGLVLYFEGEYDTESRSIRTRSNWIRISVLRTTSSDTRIFKRRCSRKQSRRSSERSSSQTIRRSHWPSWDTPTRLREIMLKPSSSPVSWTLSRRRDTCRRRCLPGFIWD